MMSATDKRKLLQHVAECGVEFFYKTIGGHVELTPEQVITLLESGAETLEPELYGVSPEHYKAWKEHIQNPRCNSLNKQGKPCKGCVEPIYNPKSYDPEVDGYCWRHGKSNRF